MKRIKQFFLTNSNAVVAFFVGVAVGCFLTTATVNHSVKKATEINETHAVWHYVGDTTK